jgi:hypothetical protein
VSPPRDRRPANPYGKVWGPGAPGQRLPNVRLSWQREIPHGIVVFGGVLVFIILYMQFLRATPGHTSVLAGEPAAETTRAVAAVVDSATRPRPFQGLLDGAQDGAPIDGLDTTKPTDPYRMLMWNLKRYSVAEVSSLAETVSADDLVNSPDVWRGRFVRATGVLIRPAEIQRLGTNEAGYENRWRGFLVDDDSGNAIAFDLFDKPDKEFDRTDVVTLEGVFLQVVAYEARGGTKRVPFLEAKSVRPFTGERVASFASNPTTLLLAGALLLAALPVLGYMVSSFLQRRHEADLVKALEKARQRRGPAFAKRAADKAAASPAPAGAAPAPPPATAEAGAVTTSAPQAAPEAGAAAAPPAPEATPPLSGTATTPASPPPSETK